MTKRFAIFASTVVLLLAGLTACAQADPKVIKTQKVKDTTITLSSEAGQFKQGNNSFMLEFTGADKKPVDAGKVTLNTSMAMPGMSPMLAVATLEPDGPGRYKGAISFPDKGERQVTVTWDGPAGKGSTKFAVPVR